MQTEQLIKEQPVLSICIPTYNRAEYLRGTLENITSDPAFNDHIEIVISDNASTDNTKEVAEKYCNKYDNVHYFRNDENIRDANFNLCLRRASGVYRKLCNDTCRFKEGKLKEILIALNKNDTRTPIFFFPVLPFLNKGIYRCNGIEDFINKVGYFIGWLLTFGVYKDDLDCLDVDQKYVKLQFVQVAWALEIIKKHSSAIIVVDDFYNPINPSKKGGYNLFKVQISNLFSILSEYGLRGWEYEIQKYRLFKYHIIYRINEYLIRKDETAFDLTNSWQTLIKEYGFKPYFFPKVMFYYSKNLAKISLRKLHLRRK